MDVWNNKFFLGVMSILVLLFLSVASMVYLEAGFFVQFWKMSPAIRASIPEFLFGAVALVALCYEYRTKWQPYAGLTWATWPRYFMMIGVCFFCISLVVHNYTFSEEPVPAFVRWIEFFMVFVFCNGWWIRTFRSRAEISFRRETAFLGGLMAICAAGLPCFISIIAPGVNPETVSAFATGLGVFGAILLILSF